MHNTIACCGLDCGLCPSYQTESASKCPGCMGQDFHLKHPSCGIATCCVKKHSYETCAECPDLPCTKLKGWDLGDSFISHKVSLKNLEFIKNNGVKIFLQQQRTRQTILEHLLSDFNDGRSKSFYCKATALLPLDALAQIQEHIQKESPQNQKKTPDSGIKERTKQMKLTIENLASKENIVLKLNKK